MSLVTKRGARRQKVSGVALLAAASTLLAAVQPSHAAPGPAPQPQERRVIADVHTDAIATFWEDGQLALAAKADTPEPGTRYEADDVWFHVDQDSRVESLPAGFDFVAPQGSTVWLAPETQQAGQIWPGFSTESVPAGTLDGDDTTFTLVDVVGPGDVELWTTGAFGSPNRLWSSDENAYKSFTRKRTHMHANWAFTAPGVYDLTVEASGSAGGAGVVDTAVYTFVVGDLPEQVATTTSLRASATDLDAGEPVTLTASVAPAGVEGHVELRNGDTVLGHEPVDDGTASFETELPVGRHSISAHFVPGVANLAAGSASAPLTIEVTDPSGVPFGVDLGKDSFEPGDTAEARVVGHTLAEGETYRWVVRAVGHTQTYLFDAGSEAASGTGSFLVDMGLDGYEIAVQLRSGGRTTAQTPWVTIPVHSSVEPVTGEFPREPVHLGDDFEVRLGNRALAEGETLRLAYRFSSPWNTMAGVEHVDDRLVVRPRFAMTDAEWVVQVLSDGVVVAQSEPVAYDVRSREVLVEGHRPVYRVGQTIRMTATVDPGRDGLLYRWYTYELVDGSVRTRTLEEGTGAEALTVELPATIDLDGEPLAFAAIRDPGPDEVQAAHWSTSLVVSDADPSTQLLFFEGLSGHYHQGGPIDLRLVADPALAEGDTLDWEWKWPGVESWTPLPGATGLSHRLVAEQALEGVQVRATLTFGDSSETVTTDPVTLHVDDHGAPPRQQPTVHGATSYVEGDAVTLTRVLPENAPTVLTGHRWERRAAGSAEFAPIEGETEATLSFEAALEDDGAEYRVSVLKPDGSVAYGPSPAVALDVAEPATELGIRGVQPSYDPGDTLTARVVGHTLEEGQSYRWYLRPVGTTGNGAFVQSDVSATLTLPLSASDDGYELSVGVRQGTAASPIAQTSWIPINVVDLPGPVPTVTRTDGSGPFYSADLLELTAAGYELEEGQSLEFVYRAVGRWIVAPDDRLGTAVGARRIAEDKTLVMFVRLGGTFATEWAARIVEDGVAVRQSDPIGLELSPVEANVEGVRPIYREGGEIELRAGVHPSRDLPDITYEWRLEDTVLQTTGVTEPSVLSLVASRAEHHGKRLFFEAKRNGVAFVRHEVTLNVTDDVTGQIFELAGLAGHYHQGGTVDLSLIVDPAPAAGDTIGWEWKWPGMDWAPFPGASGTAHPVVAEQALDGVQVRATLDFAEAGREPIVAAPVTIHVDDHGAPARQQPTVTGTTSYVEGDTVTLARTLPENGPTLLTGHRWERRAAGTEDFTVVEGETGETLTFAAALADDDAEYRVAILKPDGSVAYGPSPAVRLEVAEGATDPEPVATTISVRPVRQVYGTAAHLTVTVAPQATGRVSARIGSRTVSAALADGRATLRLPPRGLAPGRRHVKVSYAGVAGEFLPATATARVTVAKAKPRVRATVRPKRVRRGKQVSVAVRVAAAGVRPTGKVTVALAGRSRTVKLTNGRATVRIRAVEPGRTALRVRYLGDRNVARAQVRSSIRVVNR